MGIGLLSLIVDLILEDASVVNWLLCGDDDDQEVHMCGSVSDFSLNI